MRNTRGTKRIERTAPRSDPESTALTGRTGVEAHASGLPRRRFLQAAGVAASAGVTAACGRTATQRPPASTVATASGTAGSGGSGSGSGSASVGPGSAGSTAAAGGRSSTPSSAASGSSPAAPVDFGALAKSMRGKLIRPGDATYDAAYQLFNPVFDGIRPQAVAQCVNASDVAEAVKFAARSGVPLAMRSGGHCYAGWSTGPGLIIDTRALASVDQRGKSALVGAGARLIDVYAALAKSGVGIPGGSCPTVGIAGLTLGGGIGVVDRAWGLASDNLTAVALVTADGKIRNVDQMRNPDLFWACRGGGGGSFGVVTGLTFATRTVGDVVNWSLHWSWSQASAVLVGWQRWIVGAPDEVWSSVHLSSAPNSSTPVVSVVGMYLGDTGSLSPQLDALISAVGAHPTSQVATGRSFIDAMLYDAGCSGYAACHLAPGGTVTRQAYAGSSDIIGKPLSNSGVSALLGAVISQHNRSGAPDVAVEIDALGGAINRVTPGATAFVHRRSLATVQYIANWYDSTPASAVRTASAWPHATRERMSRYMSGAAYQNYVDVDIANWASAYFGSNYPRLQKVKAKWDPTTSSDTRRASRPDDALPIRPVSTTVAS